MSKPFSKLKKQIEDLFVPELKMEICCLSYPVRSQRGSSSIPRFYVRLNKEIIWDFPTDFPVKEISFHFWADSTIISELIRIYLDSPVNELLYKPFELEEISIIRYDMVECDEKNIDFNLQLTDLLKAADRRFGKDKLLTWAKTINNPKVNLILKKRFNDETKNIQTA